MATSSEGRVFVHDANAPRIWLLTDQLQPVRSFGRAGRGPGELTDRMIDGTMLRVNTLAAGEDVVYVSNLDRVLAFRPDGHFIRSYRGPRVRSPVDFSVRGLSLTPDGILVGHLHGEPSSPARQLRTLLVRSERQDDDPLLQHELRLADLPSTGGFSTTPARQAKPLWGALGRCVVVGDGASPWLLRLDLASGSSDTLRLPHHRVPAFTQAELSASARRMALLELAGIAAPPALEPTELWRYTRLIVDPDGHVWVEAWHAPDAPDTRQVYRIDSAGAVHFEELPAFPLAFGAPGVYFAAGQSPTAGDRVLVRYELRR